MLRSAVLPILAASSAALAPAAWAGPTLAESLLLERGQVDAVGSTAAETTVDSVLTSTSLRARQPWLVAPVGGGRTGVTVGVPLVEMSPWRVRLGLGAMTSGPRHLRFEGSELAARLAASEVYASVQRRHWGPGHLGSLILDGGAEPLSAIGWRRPRPVRSDHVLLGWLGPWTGDLFIAGLTGHQQPARPALIGMRLQAQPWSSLRLGLSRAIQWGGRGRPEGLRSLTQALTGSDNVANGGTTDDEPGNQLAGFDWRWVLRPEHDLAWYGQIVGEDEAGRLPSMNFPLTGLEVRQVLDDGTRLRLFMEWSHTLAGSIGGAPRPGIAYRHHIYRQGYTNDGIPLGHPLGGDVELGAVGVLLERGALSATLVGGRGHARSTAQRFAPGRLWLANAAFALRAGNGHRLGLGLWATRSAGDDELAAQAWWQYAWP